MMKNQLISCCGLNCETCEARIATVNNDRQLREITAEKWRKLYNAEGLTAEMINCTGCRMEGTKIGHWNECRIRNCASDKGYETCGECNEIDNCEIVAFVHNAVPQAKQNLLDLN